jgi:hypothetical protein
MTDLSLQTPKWRSQALQKLLTTPIGKFTQHDSGAATATVTATATAGNNNSAAAGNI